MVRLEQISVFEVINLEENATFIFLRYMYSSYSVISIVCDVLGLVLCNLVPSGTASLSANMRFGMIVLDS